MPVYVISLDRSADRYASFLTRNSHLPDVVRARAVEGAKLDRADLQARGLLSTDADYSMASLGCAISHACVWQIAAGLNAPLTVAEDDAIFREDFPAAAPLLLARLRDWDLMLWGWNFNSMLCIDLMPGISPAVVICDQPGLRAGIERFQSTVLQAAPHPLLRAHGSCAYTVSPAGARKLLRLCLPIRAEAVPFPVVDKLADNTGIDMMMSLAYPRMRAFVSLPPLAVSEHRRDSSTIQGAA